MDVAGHGVASSMVAMNVAQYLNPSVEGCVYRRRPHGELMQPLDPATAMAAVNDRFVQQDLGDRYLTCIYGVLDCRDGAVQLVRAGHPNPIHLSDSGQVLPLTGDGDLPIGLFPGVSYQNMALQLQPGGRLCLYSDGITECEGPGGEFYGEERLQAFLKLNHGLPTSQLVESFNAEIKAWHGPASGAFSDDISLLIIEYQPRGPAATKTVPSRKE
jgi:sigma-B regulation protein RsbU (phosphoserine phosphatase)